MALISIVPQMETTTNTRLIIVSRAGIVVATQAIIAIVHIRAGSSLIIPLIAIRMFAIVAIIIVTGTHASSAETFSCLSWWADVIVTVFARVATISALAAILRTPICIVAMHIT